MATPDAQSDNALSGRTAPKSTVSLSEAAGSEKTTAGDPELKYARPAVERAAARPSFSGAVAGAPRITAAPAPALPKLAPPAVPVVEIDADPPLERGAEAQAIRDWGLSERRPPRRRTRKLTVALFLLVAAGGGYAVYTQMFADRPDADELTKVESDPAPLGATDDSDGADESDDADPFDDAPVVNSRTRSRLAANTEPRRIDIADDATPIIPRGAAGGRERNLSRSRNLALDADALADVAADRQPDELSDSELDEGPDTFQDTPRNRSFSDRSPGDRARRQGTLGRNDSLSSNNQNPRRSSSAGPRLADDDDETQDPTGVPADDRLDGYEVADKPGAATSRGGSRRASVSVVEATDDPLSEEKLEGYMAEDVSTHRAVSKTVVVRANRAGGRHASTADSSAFGRENAEDGAPEERFARPGIARGANNGALHRGTSVPAGGDGPEPVSDTYRVSPDDNFWKISRKLYGTARYYQALMRHNQDRVPDPQKLRPGTQILTPPAAVLEESYPDLIERGASGTPSGGRAPGRTSLRPAFEQPLEDPVDRHGDASDTTAGAQSSPVAGYFYSPSGEPLYRIGHDDTLGSIAQRHLGRASRWQEIFDLNQDVLQSPDNLTLGSVIRLPSDASRVGLAPESDRRR